MGALRDPEGRVTVDIRIYKKPNPVGREILMGSELRHICDSRANTALLLYQAQVAKRTGALAAAAHAHTEIGGNTSDRWIGVLTVGGDGVDYGASHEFGRGEHPGSIREDATKDDPDAGIIQHPAHDLNVVLESLSAF
jgi:hypothetical protein